MKQILEKCKSEIADLKMCGECYRNSNADHGFFTTVCTARHKLVWAKLKGEFPKASGIIFIFMKAQIDRIEQSICRVFIEIKFK